MKIAKTIVEAGIQKEEITNTRTTVRGIMVNDNKEILMLYSSHYDDYTFPGGGVEGDEDMITTLLRELSEEIGARDVEVIKKIGYISELKYVSRKTNTLCKQTSHYYLCNINSFGKTNHIGVEQKHGLKAKWVNIDTAIKHNEIIHDKQRQYRKGLKTVLLRENEVLNHIKELFDA